MRQSVTNLIGDTISAKDGEIGSVDDLYFNDESWIIRYIIVDTGGFLKHKKVLIHPAAVVKSKIARVNTLNTLVDAPDSSDTSDADKRTTLTLNLTVKQIQDSPSIDTKRPLNRQDEVRLFMHYAWPFYWMPGLSASDAILGNAIEPGTPYRSDLFSPIPPAPGDFNDGNGKGNGNGKNSIDPHLLSVKEVLQYGIHASDGGIGHVEDLIFDNERWKIRYLLIDTSNWLVGQKTLIPLRWIKYISWLEENVMLDLSREIIKNAPEYDHSKPLNHNQEYINQLHAYYNHLDLGRPPTKSLPEELRPHN